MSHEQDVSEYDAIDPDLINHTWECDAKNCTADTGELNGSYSDAWTKAKAAGWRCRPIEGVWQHFCPKHAR